MNEITAQQALDHLIDNPSRFAFIDVRSELEFSETGIEGFQNLPILIQAERAKVGIRYKEQGRDSAIRLGENLLAPFKPMRVARWRNAIAQAEDRSGIITCFRGGLRSKYAVQWLEENGEKVLQVKGGYRAIRRELLKSIAGPHSVVLLSGLTGTGKSRLLTEVLKNVPGIDLEKIAGHSGSSFGNSISLHQPSQTYFENHLALKLRQFPNKTLLLEDESKYIGRRQIPEPLYAAMVEAPLIVLEESIEARTQIVYESYVLEPLATDFEPETLLPRLDEALLRIKARLGGDLMLAIQRSLKLAFQSGCEPKHLSQHAQWIKPLLTHYYDPLYLKARARRKGEVLFSGNKEQCRNYILNSIKST